MHRVLSYDMVQAKKRRVKLGTSSICCSNRWVILLLLIIGAPLRPIRLLGQGIIKLIIGAVFLFFLNTLGNQVGIHVPINLVTSAVAWFIRDSWCGSTSCY